MVSTGHQNGRQQAAVLNAMQKSAFLAVTEYGWCAPPGAHSILATAPAHLAVDRLVRDTQSREAP
jgi:hypothetical protein